MEVSGGTEESPWNDGWRWVEGQRRARGMMNGGGWRDMRRDRGMMNGGGWRDTWNDEWRWVEGQRRARGMMNGGGWRDRGEPVE